ncbi:formate dehydrogenase accessory sulfurtransferase FdhD [Oceanicoccus sp. KOV_DT_Chl]|uniref:formate dehydrogenase accessory sulfurtransferase FdhD n=1 Tax=Oceanicoccus sp. KOV_DT_Chl TaxID=1904639 RepID=UPI000C799083|nr:formate dehydrogenase accessory sulfurtransferase FdhD [Oceanicoccus sp. KOV_DT_Chl]
MSQSNPDKFTSAVNNGTLYHAVVVWPEGDNSVADTLAVEIPVALVYNGISHAVMMATPSDLENFACGFSLSEGIIDRPEDIYEITIHHRSQGIELAIEISSQCFSRLKDRRRTLAGSTGCGLCGVEALQQVALDLTAVNPEQQFLISHSAIDLATASLQHHQPAQKYTGGMHGAAWCNNQGHILQLFEDVGRHNALDKLLGSLWGCETINTAGFLLMSSRASYEIVQKAARANIAVIVTVSAATSLAVEMANRANITLVGFSRENRHVVYTHAQRLTEQS